MIGTTPSPREATKKVAILQSNYIPWKGYFDLIGMVDEFILYDDVQFTRRDWRNRNLIKTAQGLQWLTIPVQIKGRYHQSIRDTEVSDPDWRRRHWAALCHNYAKAPHFRDYQGIFAPLYLERSERYLSEINFTFLTAICLVLGIKTALTRSSDYHSSGAKTERLLQLCKAARASHYVSGPAAKVYIDEPAFEREGIALSYIDYSGYRPYPQLFGTFEHKVSVLDLLFNTGPEAVRYLLGSHS